MAVVASDDPKRIGTDQRYSEKLALGKIGHIVVFLSLFMTKTRTGFLSILETEMTVKTGKASERLSSDFSMKPAWMLAYRTDMQGVGHRFEPCSNHISMQKINRLRIFS